ncbi:MAG: transporter substrate-binding domain-containing protein [Burkholderiaceae bacterium]
MPTQLHVEATSPPGHKHDARRCLLSRIASASLAGALGVCIATPVQAATYTIGVEDTDQPPMFYIVDGQYRGYGRELLDAFAATRGDHFEYVALPIKRLYQQYFQGKSLDFKFPDSPDWHPDGRQALSLSYSASTYDVTAGLMVRRTRLGLPIESVRELGTLRGFTPWLFARQINTGSLRVNESQNTENLMHQIQLGRLDAAYVNIDFSKSSLHKMGLDGEIVYDPNLPHATIALRMSTLHHPEVLKDFDEFLRRETGLQ